MAAPFWRGLDKVLHPLTDEYLVNPNPDDLDSYEIVRTTLYQLWGDPFMKWLFGTGWEQAVEEAGGITIPN
jgi:hypothetical protein